MPQCPQCNKPLVELARQCPTCRADLDLLVDYVNGLQGSLYRADQLTRAGELGLAVWAYLQVLEVDPDNPTARQQVSQVANVVRVFDRTATGRRWAGGLPPLADEAAGRLARWLKAALLVCALLCAFSLGLLSAGLLGEGGAASADPPPQVKDQPQLGK